MYRKLVSNHRKSVANAIHIIGINRKAKCALHKVYYSHTLLEIVFNSLNDQVNTHHKKTQTSIFYRLMQLFLPRLIFFPVEYPMCIRM